MVSWFGPKNQMSFDLSVAPQNQQREVSPGHASRSSSLLHLEASQARVTQSGLKTSGGVTMGDERGIIIGDHVELKLKMDRSMRRAMSDPSTPR
jgi:hypothetical protein